MRSLPPTELLQHWEAGQTGPRWAWATALVAAAFPELGVDEVDALTVGERDRRLLELREALFGPRLSCRSACPRCAEPVEMTVEIAALSADTGYNPRSTSDVRAAAGQLRVRPPTARDLAAAADGVDVDGLRERLLRRCVVLAGAGDEAPELSPADATLVIAAMAAADPSADLRLALDCPACGRSWSEVFDIVTFLWTELDDWAGRQLRDIHALAFAYGWSEAEILALSPARRARYLELVDA